VRNSFNVVHSHDDRPLIYGNARGLVGLGRRDASTRIIMAGSLSSRGGNDS